MIRIGCLSDIHGQWNNIMSNNNLELLILAGDLGKTDSPRDQREELKIEIPKLWKKFSGLQEIIIVPGNHDFLLERIYRDPLEVRELLGPGVKLLIDSKYTYLSSLSGDEVKIYGNPRTDLYSFAFSRLPGNFDISRIPEDIDILITHDAPRNYGLDCIKNTQSGNEAFGSVALDIRVREIKPKYHIFGHIHWPCKLETPETTYLNVALTDNEEITIIEYNAFW